MAILTTLSIAASLATAPADHAAPHQSTPDPHSSTVLMVLTGRESDIDASACHLAASQDIFDQLWLGHMGARAERAAQGWPMTPQIDFDACEVVFVFGGDSTNANGYRVVETIGEQDAVTVRIERISYQTASFDGPDRGDPVRPWAMILLPRTDRTILVEENAQSLIGAEPSWKPRAAFPGLIGVGRVVEGTRQEGQDGR